MRLFFLLFLFPLSLLAQNEKLSLEFSINGPNNKPEKLKNLQFVPGQAAIVYWDNAKLLKQEVKGKKASNPEVILSVAGINEQLDVKGIKDLEKEPKVTFVSESLFYFQHALRVFTYDLYSGTLEEKVEYPAEAKNIDISPKLDAAAYTIDNNLYVVDAMGQHEVTNHTNPAFTSGQFISRQEFGIKKGTFWSPDGTMLAFYEKDESEVADYAFMDNTSTPPTVKMIKYPMAGQGSEKVAVGVYSLEKDKVKYLKTEDEVGNEADSYLAQLCWDPTNKYILLTHINRAHKQLRLKLYQAKSGNLKSQILEEEDEKFVNPRNDPQFIPGNSKDFIWFSRKSGFKQIYRVDNLNSLAKPLCSGNWVVDDIVGFDPKSKYVYVNGFEENSIDRNLYRIDLKNGDRLKINLDNGIHSGLVSPDGKSIIDIYSNPQTPMSYKLYSISGKELHTIKNSPNPLLDYKTGEIEIGSIKADDDTKLFYRIIKPSFFKKENKYPVFVYVYNGPNSQKINNSWLNNAEPWLLWMAEQGFIVFTIEGRGTKNRGEKFEKATYKQLGAVELKDQLKGIEIIKMFDWVDSERIGIYGRSYGGFMTLNMMLNAPDLFKVGVSMAPVTDWNNYEAMWTEKFMGLPKDNTKGYENARLNNKSKELKGDLLLLYGTNDWVVLPMNSELFIADCIKNDIYNDVYVYPGVEHHVKAKDKVFHYNQILNYIIDRLIVKE